MDSEKRILQAWLKNRDVQCPCCKYNLRGLASGRCPECGSLVTLSVKAQAPLGLTIAIVGIGASLGLEVTYGFNYLAQFLAMRTACPWSLVGFQMLYHGGAAVVLAAIMLVLLRMRRSWWRLGESESNHGTGFRDEHDRKGAAI